MLDCQRQEMHTKGANPTASGGFAGSCSSPKSMRLSTDQRGSQALSSYPQLQVDVYSGRVVSGFLGCSQGKAGVEDLGHQNGDNSSGFRNGLRSCRQISYGRQRTESSLTQSAPLHSSSPIRAMCTWGKPYNIDVRHQILTLKMFVSWRA